jgi:hypothetical protein
MASLSLQCDQDVLILVVSGRDQLEACQTAARTLAQSIIAIHPTCRAAIASWPLERGELAWTSRAADLATAASKARACDACAAPDELLDSVLGALAPDLRASRACDTPVLVRAVLVTDCATPITDAGTLDGPARAGAPVRDVKTPIFEGGGILEELLSLPGMASIFHIDSLALNLPAATTAPPKPQPVPESPSASSRSADAATAESGADEGAGGDILCPSQAVQCWQRALKSRRASPSTTGVVDKRILRPFAGPSSLCLSVSVPADLWDSCAALVSHPMHRAAFAATTPEPDELATTVGVGSLAWKFVEHRKQLGETGGPELPLS